MKTFDGFKAFILRGNVVDLAIGIVIGAAFTTVVNAFVNDVITPLIPAGTDNQSIASWIIKLPYGDGIKIGVFINAVISFLIVAAVLYFFVVRPTTSLIARYKPKTIEVHNTRDCPYCLQAIPILATRCAFCTSPVPPVQQETEPTANTGTSQGI